MDWLSMRLLLFLVLTVVLLLVWQQIKWRRGCRFGAAQLYQQMKEMYAGEHEYSVLSEITLPAGDRAGYRSVREFLLLHGFRYLGSFENLTVSRIHPEHRTHIEAYVSEDGVVGAGTYRVQTWQTVDFGTTLEDGRFLVTTNAELDKLTPPPAVMKCRLPTEVPLDELLATHLRRIDALRNKEPEVRMVLPSSLAEIIDISRRCSGLVSEYRRSVGLLTEAEILSWSSRTDQDATAKAIWKAFQQLRRKDGVAKQTGAADRT